MSSKVFICNLALSSIGAASINSLTEDSAEARACNRFYDHVLDMVLQSHPWRFAGKTAALASTTNPKLGSWEYAYVRPTDCIMIRSIRREYTDVEVYDDNVLRSAYGFPYEVEADRIYCDLSPAYLRYTFRLTDPTKYPALFTEAFSWHLAVRLAMPITRDPKVRADAWQVAAQMQSAAEASDANQVRETTNTASEIVAAREGPMEDVDVIAREAL